MPFVAILVVFSVAMASLARMPRRVVFEAGLVLAAALVVRFLVTASPSNFYTDLYGPIGAAAAGELRRHSSLYAVYQQLDLFVPMTAERIFDVHRVLGALSITLLHLTLVSAGGKRESWSRAGVRLATLFFVVDPLEVRLHASDAIHVLALFAFSVGAFLYARSVSETDEATSGTPVSAWSLLVLGSIFCCAALTGQLRAEQVLFPLAYPVLVGGLRGGFDPRRWIARSRENIVVVGGVVISAWISIFQTDALRAFNGSILQGFLGQVASIAALLANDVDTPNILAGELGLAFVSAIAARRAGARRPAALLAFIGIMLLTRVGSNQAASFAGWNITFGRYDIIFHLLLLTLAGDGLARVLHTLRRTFAERGEGPMTSRARATVAGCSVVLGWVLFADLPHYRPTYQRELSFQREYNFLATEVGRQPRSCDVITVWSTGQDGQEFETLALPHPLLQWSARDRHYRIVSPGAPLPRLDPRACHLYFEGSICQLALDRPPEGPWRRRVPSIAVEFPASADVLRRAQSSCRALRAASTDVLAEDDGPADATYWPYRDGRFRPRLYRLDPTRLAASSAR